MHLYNTLQLAVGQGAIDNTITLTGNNSLTSVHKTPFNLIGNPDTLRNGSNDQNYVSPYFHNAIIKVFFSNSSGNIIKNKLYFIRAFTHLQFAIYETASDAAQDANRINLSGFSGGVMKFPNKTYPPRRAKAYQLNEECCGTEYKTIGVPNTCKVTFDGNEIVCKLTNGGGWKHCLFSGSLDNYQTSDGSTADLGFLVTVYHDGTSASDATFGTKTGVQVEVACGLYYLSNGTPVFDSKSTYGRALQNHASFDLSGTVTEATTFHPNGPGWDGITSIGYEFSGNAAPPQQMRVKLPNAKFLGVGGPSIGNIDEILTFETSTCSYVSETKNYYNIPGRLTAELDFYPTVFSGYKFLGNLSPVPFSPNNFWQSYFGSVGYRSDNKYNIDTSEDIKTLIANFNNTETLFHMMASTVDDQPEAGFKVGDLYFDIFMEKYLYPGITPKVIISYSRSQSVRYPEPNNGIRAYFDGSANFFKGDRFLIYSDDANAIISTYRLND